MKIKFLGSGSAFVKHSENFQSNILIDNMLYDCGSSIGESLDFNNISLEDIDSIFISHMHSDHIGGLEYVGFNNFFVNGVKTNLILPEELITNIGDYLQLTMGQNPITKDSALNGYFNLKHKSTKLKLIETEHTADKSYGLSIDNILITGDSKVFKSLREYNNHEIIFHDCEFQNYKGSVHAQYHELLELPKEIKSKMYLYHYILPKGTSFQEQNLAVIKDGFLGIIKRGQEFIF